MIAKQEWIKGSVYSLQFQPVSDAGNDSILQTNDMGKAGFAQQSARSTFLAF
jgi:hypothetical protein